MGIKGGTTTAMIDGQEVVVGGDVILSVEGIPVGSADALAQIRRRMTGLSAGSPFKVTLLRKGQVLELTGQVP
jgi:serine protease Do